MLTIIESYDQLFDYISSNYSFLPKEEKYATTFNINRTGMSQSFFSQFTQEKDSDLIDVTGQELRFYPSGFFIKRMLDYEKEYGIPSSTFYRLYSEGRFERSKDFSEWAIIYKSLIVDRK